MTQETPKSPDEIAAWEDGFRTGPGGPGTFELNRPDGTHVQRPLHAHDDFAFAGGPLRRAGRTLTGTGYHDHNWGDAAMPQLIRHWYWARAQAGGYCVIETRLIESVRGFRHVFARIAGFDGAYMRFTGQVTVERIGRDAAPEAVTAPALWELMYFGKTNRNRYPATARPAQQT